MKLITEKAEKIGQVQGIIEIILIVNILINCFKLYQQCKKKPADIMKDLAEDKLGVREKVHLRRLIIKEFGALDYIKRKKEIEAEILKTARSLSEEEVTQMFQEAQSQAS